MPDFDYAKGKTQALVENIKKVIVGKPSAIEMATVSLLCEGHALIEDVPGVGKTMLARSVAKSIGCSFRRIQFTPDLLPSDITGVSIYNQKAEAFEYKEGPIISQIVLADEINRATPKTQSALLEAMDERQVTVEGVTHELPRPFTVMATQNPIEYEGTFPLPEAQLDRFLITINLGYPSVEQELSIINNQETVHPIESLGQVLSSDDVLSIQEAVKTVYVDDLIREYIVGLVDKSRTHAEAALGASPRGSLALFRGTQALALIRGRDFVLPDDVKELAAPMLSHRIIVSPAGRMRGVQSPDIVEELIEQVAVPGAQTSGWFRT
ncbi:MAG: MoxR family ATPase [SAR202 cluster bacterium]|nr:MoxR family ATPase [SAR202 cluster bacterium]